MKIVPANPATIAAPGALDDSRFGNHVKPLLLDEVRTAKHGIVILGFADDTGVRNVGGRPGAAEGPNAIRARLYKFTTGATAVPVYDLGDLAAANSIEETHAQGAALVRDLIRAGHEPLVLGGGHDLGFPHALGVMEGRGGHATCLVNIDAHLDVRPVRERITSGSPWFLLREHPLFAKSRSRVEEFGLQTHCNAFSLVEYAIRHGFGMHWLHAIRASRLSVAAQLTKLLKSRSKMDQVISFDIDSVQWADAPGCSAPQNVGFTAAEALALSFAAGAQKEVRSFGLFELSPAHDPDGRTASLAAQCVRSYLAGRGVWRPAKNSAPKKRPAKVK